MKHPSRVEGAGLRLASVRVVSCLPAVSWTVLRAQSDFSRLHGDIPDQPGALFAGANIPVANPNYGAVRTAVSERGSQFQFEDISRRNFGLDVSAAGFGKCGKTERIFPLEALSTPALTFQLNSDGTNTSAFMTEAAPIVNASRFEVGPITDVKRVSSLRLDGPIATPLALHAPGVPRGRYSRATQGIGQNAESWRYSEMGGTAPPLNGMRALAVHGELDGLDKHPTRVNPVISFPPVGVSKEFRVTTAVAPTIFSHGGGATVQSSIKSGTDSYHRSAVLFDNSSSGEACLKTGRLIPDRPAGYGESASLTYPRSRAIRCAYILMPNPTHNFLHGDLQEFYDYSSPMDDIPVSSDLGMVNAIRIYPVDGAENSGGRIAYYRSRSAVRRSPSSQAVCRAAYLEQGASRDSPPSSIPFAVWNTERRDDARLLIDVMQ
ncbi:MAG: hypothetical protein ACP5E5_01605 [Acidobacteriaceae bacterium]